jgi:DNA-binding response OmpR family regulator
MNNPRAHILLVDDEEINLTLLERILTLEHYSIAKARDGIEALDKFEKYQPDLVILDLVMPRLNGYEVCVRLKRLPSAKSVPILLLTSMSDDDSRQKALRSGVDDFLTKPFHCTDLLQHIRALLARRFPSPTVIAPPASAEGISPAC